MNAELTVDASRLDLGATGIYVRAKRDGLWVSADIATLDRASLLAWLTEDGSSNRLAENVVGVLLGHGHLHKRLEATA